MEKPSEIVHRLIGNDLICMVDVGAASGLAKRWRPIASTLDVIAFEPDARSIASVGHDAARVAVIDRAAAAHEGSASLYLTRKPRCSSLRAPNRDVTARYPAPERYDVLDTRTVECTTVDAALSRCGSQMDFIKIDTQGTELEVLRGAERSLENCLGIEVEVEFQQLYCEASLFRDVDRFISQFGFEIFDLRRTFFPRQAGALPQRKGQLVFGDALYFRDWRGIRERGRLIKLAALMLAYGFGDVVLEMANAAPLLNDIERRALEQASRGLRPIRGNEGERKDAFVGSGLQLT